MMAAKLEREASTGIKIDPHLIIDPQKLVWGDKIGKGGCGEVYKVEHADWGVLAIKKLGVTLVDER